MLRDLSRTFILNMSKVSIYQNIWSLPVFFVPLPSNIRGACRNVRPKTGRQAEIIPIEPVRVNADEGKKVYLQ